ncbi:MAG: hypothetical protein M1276_07835 [Deltaproteobacteria bacterium]|jgi:hypothetical protein|nr:hypothetical protein [Deltaproteobacteria bacterium]
MKILHILKREPSETERTIIDIHSKSNEITVFKLYSDDAFSYDDLLKKVAEHDKVFCW